MKKSTILAIIAIVAIIGFSMVSCSDDDDGGGKKDLLLGTWLKDDGKGIECYSGEIKFVFTNY